MPNIQSTGFSPLPASVSSSTPVLQVIAGRVVGAGPQGTWAGRSVRVGSAPDQILGSPASHVPANALTRDSLRQMADSEPQQTPLGQRTAVRTAEKSPGRAVSALSVNPLADFEDKPVRVNSPMHVNMLESQWDENIDALRPERAALMKLADATSRAEYIAEALAKSPQADRLLAQRLVSASAAKLCSPTDLVLKGGLIEKLVRVNAAHHTAVVLSECIGQANEEVTADVLSKMIKELGKRGSCLSDSQKIEVIAELIRLGMQGDPLRLRDELLAASNQSGGFFDLLSSSAAERAKLFLFVASWADDRRPQ